MAGNFIPIRAFIYVPGALIVALQNNTNENELYNKLGGAMNNTTGHQHTGAVGDGPKLTGASIALTAADIPIVDAGNYYPGTNVEDALQNIGSGAATNLTFTNPTINAATITGVVAGSATYNTPTLTNPTINAATITGVVAGSATYNTPTLITPTIADFTNAQHNHQNAAGGGTLDAAAITSGTFNAARIPTASLDHNSLNNLTVGDPHTQYPLNAGAETISGNWDFTNNTSSLTNSTTAKYNIINSISGMAHVTVVNDADNGTIQQQFNVASSTRNLAAPKNYQLTFTTALNNNDAAVLVTAQSGTNNRMFANYYAVGSTDVRVRVKEESGATEYGDFAAIVVGGLV